MRAATQTLEYQLLTTKFAIPAHFRNNKGLFGPLRNHRKGKG